MKYWNGAGTDKLFDNNDNWFGGAAPAAYDTVVFNDTGANKPCSLGANSPSLNAIRFTSGYTGAFSFGAAVKLRVSGDADFRSGGNFVPNSGEIELVGASPRTLMPRPSDTLPCIRQNGPGGTVFSGDVIADSLIVVQGSVDLGAGLTHTFRDFGGPGGVLLFNASTLRLVGRIADFRNVAVNGGTGTLLFARPDSQYFYPRFGASYYRMRLASSACKLKVMANGLYLNQNLALDSGWLDLGNGLSHSIGNFRTTARGRLLFNSSALSVRDTADFRNINFLSAGTGSLILAYNGAGVSLFRLKSGLVFNTVIRNGGGAVHISDAGLTAANLYVNTGTLRLDNGSARSHTVSSEISGPGSLDFGASALNFEGTTADFNSFSAIEAGTGGLNFTRVSGVTEFFPKQGAVHPNINFYGACTLKLMDNDLIAREYFQMAGTLDLNGRDIQVVDNGKFTVVYGAPQSFDNLGGRTISVSGAAAFYGISGDTMLGLNPASRWTLAVDGPLAADYAALANCSAAVSPGVAVHSADNGNNVNWIFDAKLWDGEGTDDHWSTAANWAPDGVPVATDVVIIADGCGAVVLDMPATVNHFTYSAYSPGDTFDFAGNTLSLTGDADLRFGVFDGAGMKTGGRLEFSGSGPQTFYTPFSGVQFSHVRQTGNGTVRVLDQSLVADTLTVNQGTFSLGNGTYDTIGIFAGNGTLDFGTAFMTVTGASVDFSSLDSVIRGTGTLVFSNTAPQVFRPHPAASLYDVYKAGSETTYVQASGMRVDRNLIVKSGVLHLGSGLAHTVYYLSDAAPSTGRIDFGGSALRMTGAIADFNDIAVTPGTGSLEFAFTGGNTDFTPRAGSVFPALVQDAAGGSTTVTGRGFMSTALRVTGGSFVFGNYADTVGALSGTGSLVFSSGSVLRVQGDTADFSAFSSVSQGSGLVDFIGGSGAQILKPGFFTLPPVLHSGNDTLRLSGAALTAADFSQTAGTLDLNGRDVSVTGSGSFSITSGSASSLAGLSGRTITSGGNAVLNGVPGSLLDLNPSSAWTLSVQGSLTADYAMIGRSTASAGRGVAVNSADSGGNVNWLFLRGKTWDGGAGDNAWSSPANWSDDALPDASDTVVFTSDYIGSCNFDISDTAAYLVFTSGYTGSFDFMNDTLTLLGNSDFRSGGGFSAGAAARIRFSGSSSRTFIPKALVVMPGLVQEGPCTTRVAVNPLRTTDLLLQAGLFHLGLGLCDTVETVSGAGALDFGTSSLCVRGAAADFSSLSGVSYGTRAALGFAGAAPQSFTPGGFRLPEVRQEGASTTTLTGALQADALTLADGTFDLGSGLIHSATDVSGTGGTLSFGSSRLRISGTPDFSGFSVTPSAGFLELTGSSPQTFTPGSGQVCPVLVQNGTGGATLNGGVTMKGLAVLAGALDLGDGLVHSADTLYGSGIIDFGASVLRIGAAAVDLSAFQDVLSADGGGLDFIASTGAQSFTPKTGSANPFLTHSGSATLRLQGGAFDCRGFTQSAGALDFNGADLATVGGGDLTVINGDPTSLQGLSGRTITVSGVASFSGSAGSLIGMNPASGWTVAATGGLFAEYAEIGRSTASVTAGIAVNSADSGNNVNWSFSLPRIWDGGGANSSWSTAANWSGDVLPADTDVVLFDGTSGKNCALDVSATVRRIIFNPGYFGTFSFDSETLTVTGDADFSNAGYVAAAGAGALNLSGSGLRTFTPLDSVAFPSILAGGSGRVLLNGDITAPGVEITSCTLSLGNGRTHAFSRISGSAGVLDFGSSTLKVSGNEADFGAFTAVIASAGALEFTGEAGVVQTLTPSSGGALPPVTHSGAGTLRFGAGPVASAGFSQAGGVLDFNGNNLSAAGGFSLVNGTASTIAGLSGVTISVTGNATFAGMSGDFLNLDPASGWTVAVSGALTADYARIANSNASLSAGTAVNSVNLGGNARWSFEARTWDGGGGDDRWSTAANWSGDLLPTSWDSVVFSAASVKNCVLDVPDTVGAFVFVPGYTGGFDFSGNALSVSGIADLRSGGDLAQGNGALRLIGGSDRFLYPRAVDTLPDIQYYGTGSLQVAGSGLVTDSLIVGSGVVRLGRGFTHVITGIRGSGALDFDTSAVEYGGPALDLNTFSAIEADSGTLRFTAAAGTQLLTPAAGDTLPFIEHAAGGALRLSGNPLVALGFNQVAGGFDLNGRNVTIVSGGDFTISAGDSQSLAGLSGRTLTISGDMSLSGTNGNFLNLNPAAGWISAVSGALSAQYAVIGRGSATVSPGVAGTSIDAGGNVNWTFGARTWDGGGADSNWSTAANWSGDVLPVASDSILFDNTSAKDCRLDTSMTVKAIGFRPSYAGQFDFNGRTLSLTSAGDFSGLASMAVNGGSLAFIGSGAQTFTHAPALSHPAIVHSGASDLRLAGDSLICASFSQRKGALDFNGVDVAVTGGGSFTVDSGGPATLAGLGGITLRVSGKTRLSGVTGGLLNLNPASAWNVVSADSLVAEYAVVGRSDASGGRQGIPINSTDSGNNVNWRFNAAPSVGYAVADVIPAAQVTQSLDGLGVLTIRFRVRDPDSNTVSLGSFAYSDDGGANWYVPANADASAALSGAWPDNGGSGFITRPDFTGNVYSFTFNTKHADVDSVHPLATGVFSAFRARFRADDTLLVSGYGLTDSVLLDNLAPTAAADPLLTNDLTPPLTGTVNDNSAAVSVTVAGQTSPAVNNRNGTWTLPDNTLDTLPEGRYDIVVTAADSFGNSAADTAVQALLVNPSIPIPTVDSLLTNDPAPPLTGTVSDLAATLSVTVSGQTLPAVNNGDGTWTLADNLLDTLAEGVYDVLVMARDTMGDSGWDVTVNELSIDLTPPSAGSVEIADNAGYTNSSAPLLRLSASGADSMRVALSDSLLAISPFVPYDTSAVSPVFGGEGVRIVLAEFKDRAGNVEAPPAGDSTVYDITPPSAALLRPDSSTLWLAGSNRAVAWQAADPAIRDSAAVLEFRPSPDSAWRLIGDSLPASGGLLWALPQDTGSACQLRISAFDKAGNAAADTVTFTVGLKPGVPVSLAVGPDSATVSADSALAFGVIGFDKDSNQVLASDAAWSVIGAIGSIDSTGLFTAVRAGDGFVAAEYLGVADTTDTIRVVPGSVARLSVVPDTGLVTSDSAIQFYVLAFDSDSNLTGAPPVSWALTGNHGSIDTTGLFTPDTVDTFRVAASFNGILDTSGVFVVTAGRPVLLRLLPAYDILLNAGDTLRFGAVAYDARGNFAPPGALAYSTANPVPGTVDSLGLFTALMSGSTRVAVSTGAGLSDTSGLVTVSGALVTPGSGKMILDEDGVRLVLQPGSVDSAVVITLERITDSSLLPEGVKFLSPGYLIRPLDAVFTKDILLSVSLASGLTGASDPGRLRLFMTSAADSAWDWVPGSCFDTALNAASGVVHGLGMFIAGIDTSLPVISDFSDSAVPQDSGAIIRISSRDNLLTRQISVHYRLNGKVVWRVLSFTVRGDETTSVSLDSSFSSPGGFQYALEIFDGTNLVTQAISGVQVLVNNLRNPKALPPLRYAMFSLPLLPDNDSVNAVLDTLGAYNPDQWKLYAYGDNRYVEYNGANFTRLEAGRAYWIKVRNDSLVLNSGPGRSVKADSAFTVALAPGWNMVGAPYYFNVDLGVLKNELRSAGKDSLVSGPFGYGYDTLGRGAWKKPFTTPLGSIRTLDPWEGYMFKNAGSDTIRMRIPLVEYDTGSPRRLARVAKEYEPLWYVPVTLSAGGLSVTGVAGIHENASPGLDRFDLPRPPSVESEATLSFTHPAWKIGRGDYVADFRPPFKDGDRWDFTVRAPDSAEQGVQLKFGVSDSALRPWHVYLFDCQRQYAFPVSSESTYVYAAGNKAPALRFVLLIGTMEYIRSAAEGRVGPPVFGLSQNYPNPFNPSTLIHYQLKSAGEVDLSIFDVRGRLVQRMVSAFQEPGYYKARWTALDKKRRNLPSGVYICRITVRDGRGGRVLFSKIRKMSLIR